MRSRAIIVGAAGLLAAFALASCAFHPHGESDERELARRAYVKTTPAPLAPEAALEDVLAYAYLSNADLEARYWEWRAAIERIPQDATIPATPAVMWESMFEHGKTSLAATTLTVANDPMTNIPWPGMTVAAGKRALELARAAGFRFRAAQLDLRMKVLDSYYDYALLAESIRLKQQSVSLLESMYGDSEARLRAGAGTSVEILEARNGLDLARNDLRNLEAETPGRLAAINALLSREPAEALDPPKALPAARPFALADAEVLSLLAERSPELAALAHEAKADEHAIAMMRRGYIPELGLNLSGDLEGLMKGIMVMLTAPFVRFEAVHASVVQAEAELAAARAMRRGAEYDLKARAVLSLYDLRNDERQITLFEQALIPRAEQIVDVQRVSYTNAQAPLTDFLESERMLVDLRLMYAKMRIEREKMLAEIEALAVTAPAPAQGP